jgi:hypothetical protein
MIRFGAGQRKAALYLSTLPAASCQSVLEQLPADVAVSLQKMIVEIVEAGWNDGALVESVLSAELRGLTAQSSIPLDGMLGLAKIMPADWTARIFAANVGVDAKFMLAMLEDSQHKLIAYEINQNRVIPDRLREAIVAEAMECIHIEKEAA